MCHGAAAVDGDGCGPRVEMHVHVMPIGDPHHEKVKQPSGQYLINDCGGVFTQFRLCAQEVTKHIFLNTALTNHF